MNVGFVGWFGHVRQGVVGLVAIHKAVGHDEIDHICGSESLTFAAALAASVDCIVHTGGSFVLFECNAVCAGLINSEIYEKVVWALGVMLASDLQPCTLAFEYASIGHFVDGYLCIS